MDRLRFLFLSFILIFANSCAHPKKPIARDMASLKASGKVAGVWILQGTSSTRGPYNGELELRPSTDGTFDVVRMVTYINYFYDGLRVQEVWTGKAVPDADTLTITYDLRQGEFITKLAEAIKTRQDLQTPITLTMRFLPTSVGWAAQFSDKKVSEYSEWITTSRVLDAQPLYKKETSVISAQGKVLPASEKNKIQKAQKIIGYGKDPFVQNYKNRPEYKNQRTEIVVEGGDLNFFRHHRDVLRIVNKLTDDATIAEAVLKQTAYMPSLKEKADRYEDAIATTNFSSANLVVVKKLEVNSLHAFSQDTEAAFTTGMYLASQSMRFQVTKDPMALVNMKRALLGLRGLAEVSKGSTDFAATMAPLVAEKPEGWLSGSGAYQKFIWTKGDQKQSLIGVLHGLTWAALSAPKTEYDMWVNINETLKEINLKDLAPLSSATKGTLQGLNSLVLNDPIGKNNFSLTPLPRKSFYWAGNADWAADFENTVEAINHIQIGQATGSFRAVENWKKYLNEEWQIQAPAKRVLRALATKGFAAAEKSTPSVDLQAGLAAVVRSLNEIPYPRPRMDVRIDHSGDPAWVVSPIPRNYWTVKTKDTKSVVEYYQGLQQLPLYKLQAVTSRFIWKEDAFRYQGHGDKDTESTGVDYLYAYWLGRLVGIPEVQ